MGFSRITKAPSWWTARWARARGSRWCSPSAKPRQAPRVQTPTAGRKETVVSGHSKWHNIRVKKSKVDAQKGKAFTKVSREIYMAARRGGGDPNTNFGLKTAIGRAREVNMPADNIKRVIEKATGEGDGTQYEEIV